LFVAKSLISENAFAIVDGTNTRQHATVRACGIWPSIGIGYSRIERASVDPTQPAVVIAGASVAVPRSAAAGIAVTRIATTAGVATATTARVTGVSGDLHTNVGIATRAAICNAQ
jgi:hypothetical protein